MNIEIANRLYQYRKSMGISQEELASRIGVSRQAVSKWERAEASPDTDNLIELAKIYGVTLDEMLRGGEEPTAKDAAEKTVSADEGAADEPRERVSIGFGGIHVHDKDGTKVDIDRHGIFVEEKGEQKVYTDADGHIHKSDDIVAEHRRHSAWANVPYAILTVIAYLLFGYFNICGGWGFGWIIFLTIPIYHSLVEAIEKRDAAKFAYPVLTVIAYLLFGFLNICGGWAIGWIVFLTIPIYYWLVNSLKHKKN